MKKTKSNKIAYYYYIIFPVIVLVLFTSVQAIPIINGVVTITDLIVIALVELLVLFLTISFIISFKMVEVSRESIKIRGMTTVTWKDVSILKKVPFVDIYYLKLKEPKSKILLFNGDNLPIFFLGNVLGGGEMAQIIEKIKFKLAVGAE